MIAEHVSTEQWLAIENEYDYLATMSITNRNEHIAVLADILNLKIITVLHILIEYGKRKGDIDTD